MEENDDNSENKTYRSHVSQNGRHESAQVENKLLKVKKLTDSNTVNVYETNGLQNIAACKKSLNGDAIVVDGKYSFSNGNLEKMAYKHNDETSINLCSKDYGNNKNDPVKNNVDPLNHYKTDNGFNESNDSSIWTDDKNLVITEKMKKENGVEKDGFSSNGFLDNGSVSNGSVSNGLQRNGSLCNGNESFCNGSQSNGPNSNGLLSNGSLSNTVVSNGSFTNGSLSNGSFNNGSINNGSFSNGLLSNGSISNGSFSNGYGSNGSTGHGSVSSGSISNGYVSNGCTSNGYVSNGSISNGSISNGSIRNGIHKDYQEERYLSSNLPNEEKCFDNETTNGNIKVQSNGYENGHNGDISIHKNGHSNYFTSQLPVPRNSVTDDENHTDVQNGHSSLGLCRRSVNINDSGYYDDSIDLSNDNLQIPDYENTKSFNLSSLGDDSIDSIDIDVDSDYKLDATSTLSIFHASTPKTELTKEICNNVQLDAVNNCNVDTVHKSTFLENNSSVVNGIFGEKNEDLKIVSKNAISNDTVKVIDKNGNINLVPCTFNGDNATTSEKNENSLNGDYLPLVPLDDDVFSDDKNVSTNIVENGHDFRTPVETKDSIPCEDPKSSEYIMNNELTDNVTESSCSKTQTPKKELTLFDACRQGHYDVVKNLLTSNLDLDINMTDGDSWTCLHETSIRTCQFTGITELLLQNGADPNLRDKKGETPLHGAVLFHLVDTIKLLLKYKADYNICNNTNVSPLKLATLLKDNEILLLFDQTVSEQVIEKKKRKKRKRNSHKDFVLPLNTSPSILKKRRTSDESSSSTTTPPRSKKRINFSL